jgi:hypothetical protein
MVYILLLATPVTGLYGAVEQSPAYHIVAVKISVCLSLVTALNTVILTIGDFKVRVWLAPVPFFAP